MIERPAALQASGGSRLTRSQAASRLSLGELMQGLRAFGYGTAVYAWRLGGRFPQRLQAVPPGLWHGNAARGQALLAGTFQFGKQNLPAAALDWDNLTVTPAMQAWLHGFGWLHDLAAALETSDIPLERAQALAEPLTKKWIKRYARFDTLAWRPDIVGERLTAWCLNPVLIATSFDHIHRSAVLNTVARNARHLARTAGRTPAGLPRIAAAGGLVIASSLLVGIDPGLSRGLDLLSRALDRMVLPDGGIDCRSPCVGLDLLHWLLALRDVLNVTGDTPPDSLIRAIDRLVPGLRGHLHRNGTLAGFHGGRRPPTALIETLIGRADVPSQPMRNGAFSGFQRLDYGPTTLIADCGPPPTGEGSLRAHAGTLAFELSETAGRLVVNCGSGTPHESLLAPALIESLRATAAHTTLVLADTNSTQIRNDGRLGEGISAVSATRNESEDGCWLTASHDGYAARFGMSHERRIFLRSDGMDLRGADILLPVRRRQLFGGKARSVSFDIRFHVDPKVELVQTQGGQGALLRLPGGVTWSFKVRGATLTVADSIMIDESERPRRTHQLVLSGKVHPGGGVINWSFKRSPTKPAPRG